MRLNRVLMLAALIMFVCLAPRPRTRAADVSNDHKVSVNWQKVLLVSKTTPTLQVVVMPPLRPGSKIHDQLFETLRSIGADCVRYVPWLPYPRLGVAELEPPTNGKTSWDFSLIDPMTLDFFHATQGHSTIINFSTVPQWMFKTEKPVPYPGNPNEATWTYEQGTELRDPNLKELGDYYARLASWYTQGGFTDEYGNRHESGHHFSLPYWEVLNEPELEHFTMPEQYTARYDAIVTAIHKVSPRTKFVGLVLAGPSPNMGTDFDTPRYFEYFLNHKNHRPGIPLDMISYHAYTEPGVGEADSAYPFTFFEQADQFIREVRYIEAIRKRLSPETRTALDELGSNLPADREQGKPGYVFTPISRRYWNLSGAFYAYLFGNLAGLGIDVVGESQFLGYPTQFPSVSLVNWETGKPNPRLWVLKLLRDNFAPGDQLVETSASAPNVFVQAFVTRDGKRKLLLVNKRDEPYALTLPGAAGAEIDYVDQTTGMDPPAKKQSAGEHVALKGFAVAVVTLR